MNKHPVEAIIKRIIRAETVDFVELASIAGLDIKKDFAGADLRHAVLSNADLRGCDFSETDFTSADLSNANLTASNLQGANFSHANLKEANLHSANLENADFTGADLSGVYLLYANIKNTTFQGTQGVEAEDLDKLRERMELEALDALEDLPGDFWRSAAGEEERRVRALQAMYERVRDQLNNMIHDIDYQKEIILRARKALEQLDASRLSKDDASLDDIRMKLSRIKSGRDVDAQFNADLLELEQRLAQLKNRD